MYDRPPDLYSPREFFLLRIGGTSRSAPLIPRSARGQRSIYIWEDPKCLIKPRSFENQAYRFLQTEKGISSSRSKPGRTEKIESGRMKGKAQPTRLPLQR